MCGRATAELEMLRGAPGRTVRKNKGRRRESAALNRKKKRPGRRGGKGSLLEKQKQITAKSHNKAPLSLPKYLPHRATALYSGCLLQIWTASLIPVLITHQVSSLHKRLTYVRQGDRGREKPSSLYPTQDL